MSCGIFLRVLRASPETSAPGSAGGPGGVCAAQLQHAWFHFISHGRRERRRPAGSFSSWSCEAVQTRLQTHNLPARRRRSVRLQAHDVL